MSAINLALLIAQASYQQQTEIESKAKSPAKAKVSPKKEKAEKSEMVQKSPSPNTSFKMPEVGSIGANGFLKMIRNAKSQSEKVLAIAAYIGYNNGQSFAEQEYRANQTARKELTPDIFNGPDLEQKKAAARQAIGFVSGIPNNQKKVLDNLFAREITAAQERDNHIKGAKNPDLSAEERKMHSGLAALEHKRMLLIREDIAKLVG